MELQGVAEEKLVAVDIGHVCRAFPQDNVIEKVLLDKAEDGAVGEQVVPEKASCTRGETGDWEVEPLPEQAGHKTVVPPVRGHNLSD